MSFACLKYLSVDELKTGEKGRELIGDPYLLKHTRIRWTGDGVGARKFRLKRSCGSKHVSLRRRRCGSSPRRNVVVERRSLIKHPLHISHFRCVPTPNVLVERRSGSKHRIHSRHFCCVPAPNSLIKRISASKHGPSILDIRDVPAVDRLVEGSG